MTFDLCVLCLGVALVDPLFQIISFVSSVTFVMFYPIIYQYVQCWYRKVINVEEE